MSAHDEGVAPEETFADVLNGFSLTGHRARDTRVAPRAVPDGGADTASLLDDLPEEAAATVRPYAWTGGRTRSDVTLAIETLVSTSDRAERMLETLCTEHQSIARLCRRSRSVAEVGALLALPLGVIRVLLGDMATLGLIDVHLNTHDQDDRPDLELMERVLRGLTRLRPTPAAAPGTMPG
jgi:hypothetical protein